METQKFVTQGDGYTEITFKTADGRLHREDGPAVLRLYDDGGWFNSWYYGDRLHRYGGPALSSDKTSGSYYINGRKVTRKVTEWIRENWAAQGEEGLTSFMRTLVYVIPSNQWRGRNVPLFSFFLLT